MRSYSSVASLPAQRRIYGMPMLHQLCRFACNRDQTKFAYYFATTWMVRKKVCDLSSNSEAALRLHPHALRLTSYTLPYRITQQLSGLLCCDTDEVIDVSR